MKVSMSRRRCARRCMGFLAGLSFLGLSGCGGSSDENASNQTLETDGGGPDGASAGGVSGAAGAGGSGASAGASTGGSSSIDCSVVGCAAPPMCDTGCEAPCVCCPCGDGQVLTENGQDLVCTGGCWAHAAGDGGNGSCDPAAEEHQREYVGDPESCQVIRFACDEGTTYFANACGCGCEQSPSCPDWFDCMPSPDGPPCDLAEIQRTCPFSGIAF
jgi:hypothetical protein